MVHWVGLESNPDVFSDYIHKLGVGPQWMFTDVFGFDPELLIMIPQPCKAFIFLYTITEKAEQLRKSQEESMKDQPRPAEPFWIKQTIGNACGTIAIIHALGNLTKSGEISLSDGIFKKYLEDIKDLSPEEAGEKLESSEDFANCHAAISTSSGNQTSAPTAEEKLQDHFIALVEVNGTLYEFDGRKNRAISHGPTSSDTFTADAAAVCQKFISQDPTGKNFAAMALCKD